MIALRRRIEHLERKSIVFPDLKDLPPWKGPPTKAELAQLKKDLAIPDHIFEDLFGAENGQ